MVKIDTCAWRPTWSCSAIWPTIDKERDYFGSSALGRIFSVRRESDCGASGPYGSEKISYKLACDLDLLAPHSAKIYRISEVFDTKRRITSVARVQGDIWARVQQLLVTVRSVLNAQHTDLTSETIHKDLGKFDNRSTTFST